MGQHDKEDDLLPPDAGASRGLRLRSGRIANRCGRHLCFSFLRRRCAGRSLSFTRQGCGLAGVTRATVPVGGVGRGFLLVRTRPPFGVVAHVLASSQAASFRPGTSLTKKTSGSIGKMRRTLRPGSPPPAILSARSMEGAVTRVRCGRAPSRISTATLIISCSPFARRRSRGQPLGHEIRNRIPGDIDVAVTTLVYPLAHAQSDWGNGILHVHDAQHLQQGAFGGELYFLGGYLHHLCSSRRGYISPNCLQTGGRRVSPATSGESPVCTTLHLQSLGSLRGKRVISRGCVLA